MVGRTSGAGHEVGPEGFAASPVDDLELTYDTLRAADNPDQALITHATWPNTSSRDALRLLHDRSVPAPGDVSQSACF
ncbi:hypothetical protein ACWERY_05670 [Streptomyces sp. NPDC004082]|uniref:hypothetical protein n=1 Tax=unclassified Streptomyces TaxID=2593676 RepID=UPI0033A5AF6B